MFEELSHNNNEPGKSLDPQDLIDTLKVERADEIKLFIHGQLDESKRNDFVQELMRDQALRLAVIETRAGMSPFELVVSDQAAAFVNNAAEAISQGNSFFPSASGLGGYEGNEGVLSVRKEWYEKAIQFSEKLYATGELEDLAIENKWIAETNRKNAKILDQVFIATNSEDPRREEAIEELAAPFHYKQMTGAIGSIKLEVQSSAPVSLSDLLEDEEFAPELSTLLCRNLYQLGLGGDKGYISSDAVLKDFGNPTEADRLQKILLTKPDLLQSIRAYVAGPIIGSEPDNDLQGKLIAAKLLLTHYQDSKDSESLKSVVMSFRNLLKDLMQNRLTRYSARRLQHTALLLAHEANQDDSIWNLVKDPLLLTLEHGHFGVKKQAMDSGATILIDCLPELKDRIPTDPLLTERVKVLAASSNIHVAVASLEALKYLSASDGIPLLVSLIAKDTGDFEIEDAIEELCDLGSLDHRAASALGTYSREDLMGTEFEGWKLSPRLKGADTAISAAQTFLSGRINSNDLGANYAKLEIALMQILGKEDPSLMYDNFIDILSHWRGQYPSLLSLASFAKEKLPTEARDEIARTVGRCDLQRNEVRDVVEFLTNEWDMTLEQVAGLAGDKVYKNRW